MQKAAPYPRPARRATAALRLATAPCSLAARGENVKKRLFDRWPKMAFRAGPKVCKAEEWPQNVPLGAGFRLRIRPLMRNTAPCKPLKAVSTTPLALPTTSQKGPDINRVFSRGRKGREAWKRRPWCAARRLADARRRRIFGHTAAPLPHSPGGRKTGRLLPKRWTEVTPWMK